MIIIFAFQKYKKAFQSVQLFISQLHKVKSFCRYIGQEYFLHIQKVAFAKVDFDFIVTFSFEIVHYTQVDHFEGIHAMPDEVEKVEGAPNFRQVIFYHFLGPRGPHIEPSMSVRPSRKKNPDHLYSLINHRRTTVNLSKEKKGKREKEIRRKGEKEKKRKREKEKKRN